MIRKHKIPIEKNLCDDCKFRFTRVFIPTKPEEFIDENGEPLLEDFNGKTDTIGINICMLTEMEISTDITLECSHYVSSSVKEEISIFKHLRD